MKATAIYTLFLSVTVVLLIGCKKDQPTEKKLPTAEIESWYDLNFTAAERDSMLGDLKEYKKSYEAIHKQSLDNSIPMSLMFDPVPFGYTFETVQKDVTWNLPNDVMLPANKEELAFYPVYKLASLIKNRKITSTELTQLYISRLKKFGDTLQCVILITEEKALQQAKRADEEIAAGKYRGPLHGIPYGIKDLLATEGTKTTWGAEPYKDQTINRTATVVKKLEEGGAILVAKLTLGALAMGDVWYGGVTKNPWNPKQGSSGSSAGSASATTAGLVGFSIGTETWGSIVSPSTRCGATGLRPSFGMVSRTGAMALSWSMDKIGPICRSALDCALVLHTIKGPDGIDKPVKNIAFNYSAPADLRKLKVGYVESYFNEEYDTLNKENDQQTLEVLKSLGINIQAVKLPEDLPVDALSIMLTAEAAAAFDELTRSNRDSLLTAQGKNAWPSIFRAARFIPAVEYINASRLRQKLINEYHALTKDYDVIVLPTYGGNQLLMTNLTGHPCLVMPNGFDDKNSPTSISFIGKLYGEPALIALGRAYQEATEWEDQHPPLFK